MRIKLKSNLKVIRKFYKLRVNSLNIKEANSLFNEYKEWIDNSFHENNDVWTLPDLTRTERLDNFCRSIKKKIL